MGSCYISRGAELGALGDLEVWEIGSIWEQGLRGRAACIHTTGSLCGTAETNTTLKQLSCNLKKKKRVGWNCQNLKYKQWDTAKLQCPTNVKSTYLHYLAKYLRLFFLPTPAKVTDIPIIHIWATSRVQNILALKLPGSELRRRKCCICQSRAVCPGWIYLTSWTLHFLICETEITTTCTHVVSIKWKNITSLLKKLRILTVITVLFYT